MLGSLMFHLIEFSCYLNKLLTYCSIQSDQSFDLMIQISRGASSKRALNSLTFLANYINIAVCKDSFYLLQKKKLIQTSISHSKIENLV